MTPETIALVRSSWRQVLPIKDTAAQLFHGQLFEAWAEAAGTLASAMKQATTAVA
ncbi:MAG: hypothetical protein V4554_04430 [Pseudomonadota bacterium]|jgi:hypothetical protein